MISYEPTEPYLTLQWPLAIESLCNNFRQVLTQQFASKVAKHAALDTCGKLCTIKGKLAHGCVPIPQCWQIQAPELNASAHHQQQCLASRIKYSNRQCRVENGPSQKHFFPRHSVVFEKALAREQTEMQMDMDQLPAAFIMTEKTQHTWMIAVRHGWKKFEIQLKQNRLNAMLILALNE